MKPASNYTYLAPAIAVAIGASLAGCPDEQTESAPLIRAVRYTTVKKSVDSGERVFSGSLEAGNQSQLSFQVPGRIRKLPVKTGQKVKKGQLIAELDPTDFELQLREARANAAQARAQSNNADANYQRVRRLYETRNTSRQDLDAARTSRDTARSAYIAARETVQRLKRQLGYTKLTALAAGTVNAVNAESNEVVAAGQPIVLIQTGQALEASVDVPEAFVRMIALGDPAQVKIGAVSETVNGIVQEIGVAAQGSGVFPVMVRLASDPKGARPGMVAEVMLKPSKNEAAVAPEGFKLPLTAIGEDREGRFVFRVDGAPGGEGKVVRQPIETGRLVPDGIYVTEGIKAGENIVTAGVSRIQDGLTVRIPAEPDEGAPL